MFQNTTWSTVGLVVSLFFTHQVLNCLTFRFYSFQTLSSEFIHIFFVGTRILIVGGTTWDESGNTHDIHLCPRNYVLEVMFFQNSNEVKAIRYKNVPSMPTPNAWAFSTIYEGRSIIGGGTYGSDVKGSKAIWELDMKQGKRLPSLKFGRCAASACCSNKTLIVSGGYNDEIDGPLDSIEMIPIGISDKAPQWVRCSLTLPYRVSCHSMIHFNKKLVLIGGYADDSAITNQVWEGTHAMVNKIEWKKMPSTRKKRSAHFSLLLHDNIYVFGGEEAYLGEGIKNDFVEIFNGRRWRIGPRFPFNVTTYNAQVVVDWKKRIIVTTNDYGIIIYDPIQGVIKNYTSFKLRKYHKWYNAFLQ